MTLECIVQVCTTRELWPPSILQLSSFKHTPFHIKRCNLCCFSFYLTIDSFDNLRSFFDLWRWSTQMRLHSFELFLLVFSDILLNAKFIKCWTSIVLNDLRWLISNLSKQSTIKLIVCSLEFLKVVAQKFLARMRPDYDFRAL